VKEVARLKALGPNATAGRASSEATQYPKPKPFTPEFAGARKQYTLSSIIESNCDHGLVVNELAQRLKTLKKHYSRDQQRDLFIIGPQNGMEVLFEVKTDLSSTSIYEAVGQLMLHGARGNVPAPKRVLVVPGRPKSGTEKALARIGIQVLPYRWKGKSPQFDDLKHIIV
jgi:hypothetical protein